MSRLCLRLAVTTVLITVMCALEGAAFAEDDDTVKPIVSRAASEAVHKAFPKAKITSVTIEDEDGGQTYELSLKEDNRETEVSVSEDGIIIEVETTIRPEELPKAVAAATAKVAVDAKIASVEKREIRARSRPVKLETPEVTYKIKVVKNDKTGRVKVAGNGTILKDLKWQAAADQENDDETGSGE